MASGSQEPQFLGNAVLNDTSVVIVVDVLLDGKHRRRILLSGDQENSNIAAKHPAGLGVDVLKTPHHGGRLYLDDKREAMEQVYLWLRPRIAIVSARGVHSLPRLAFREIARAVGTTLSFTNERAREEIFSDLPRPDTSCFKTFACGSSEQRAQTTLSLTSTRESVNAAACLQASTIAAQPRSSFSSRG